MLPLKRSLSMTVYQSVPAPRASSQALTLAGSIERQNFLQVSRNISCSSINSLRVLKIKTFSSLCLTMKDFKTAKLACENFSCSDIHQIVGLPVLFSRCTSCRDSDDFCKIHFSQIYLPLELCNRSLTRVNLQTVQTTVTKLGRMICPIFLRYGLFSGLFKPVLYTLL